jgi:basic membrane protein A
MVYQTIEDLYVNQKWEPGYHQVGLAEGGVGYVLDDSNVDVPQEYVDKVEEMKQKVISGELEPPDELEKVDAFLDGLD